MSAAQVENPYAGQGAVILDIGGDVGALVVEMPSSMEGVEVEVRPAGRARRTHGHPHHDPHVAVVNRPVGDRWVPSLVFPELDAGVHELCLKGTDEVRLTATVRGGEVTEVVWQP